MNTTAKKMSKIIDELVCFFISVGSSDIKMDLKKRDNGYELSLKSDYLPAERKKINDLDRFLNVTEKDVGLEEIYWQLAGVSSLGQDSELHLLGQMIDKAEVHIGETDVALCIFKLNDHIDD